VEVKRAERVRCKGHPGSAVLIAVPVQESLRYQVDVVSALPRCGDLDDDHGQAKERSSRNFPLATASWRFAFVAAFTRVSLWISCDPPTRWTRLSWRKRRSFTCTDAGSSLISSRNSVPPAG
jgi:hypothetical protein